MSEDNGYEFDSFADEPEMESSGGSGGSQTAKYDLDFKPGAVKSLCKLLKSRLDAGAKPKGQIPLRNDHPEAPPSIQDAFLGDIKDEVIYMGHRRKRNMDEDEYEETETKQFVEGLGTDLWKEMIRVGGEEMQEVFGYTAEDPGGRIHVGRPRDPDLEERKMAVVRWRDTDKAKEQFEEYWNGEQDSEADEGDDDDTEQDDDE